MRDTVESEMEDEWREGADGRTSGNFDAGLHPTLLETTKTRFGRSQTTTRLSADVILGEERYQVLFIELTKARIPHPYM